ncbi:MAG TPA: phage holin family protein [Phototrophicaceae bacterium]|nr:phage holin family protein [Phototrophicaceae bacterium]
MSTQAPHGSGRPPEGSSTPPGAPRPTMGELVARVSDQFSRILRGELELIQVKLADKAKHVGLGAAFLAVAGLLGLYALGVLIAAAILGLAVALPAWLSALIVGVVLLLIAGIAALIGKKKLESGEAPSAEETKANLKADVDAVKKGIKS